MLAGTGTSRVLLVWTLTLTLIGGGCPQRHALLLLVPGDFPGGGGPGGDKVEASCSGRHGGQGVVPTDLPFTSNRYRTTTSIEVTGGGGASHHRHASGGGWRGACLGIIVTVRIVTETLSSQIATPSRLQHLQQIYTVPCSTGGGGGGLGSGGVGGVLPALSSGKSRGGGRGGGTTAGV